jgi:hypothetical protein
VEPIGREIDDLVPAGGSARFRVSLRRVLPVWHVERVIEVAEKLSFEHLQVHVIAFDLAITPASPITMTRTPTGDYLGWFTLTVPDDPDEEEALVQVHFADGKQLIHSLTFALNIVRKGGR